ncbi:hypothetical protein [Rhizobium grahamii]|uniref:Uncharacterized protein n=1 Tax=Rhizobium grahamii CCGE 502 TaxID=990285 RepID=S3HZK2_9HYPH|nr:hypothetical protein [Rhizobium grahamii]EPE98446.1 hypothetical protein RGCCGE502_08465 [Rhizobium grahamii CCGE 502]
MTSSIHTMLQSKATSVAIANSLSVADAATIADMLLSIRVTAHTTSCLANHMTRESVEDFADTVVAAIDRHLQALAIGLYPRSSSEARAIVTRIEAIIGEVRHD